MDDLNQTFELLLSGRIDTTLNAEVTYYDYMKAGCQFENCGVNRRSKPHRYPMRKVEETATLRETINKALAKLSVKYFGNYISQTS